MLNSGNEIMKFDFATSTRILFGAGVIIELSSLLNQFGKRIMVIHTRTCHHLEKIEAILGECNKTNIYFKVTTEPTIHLVSEAVTIARDFQCELIIAIGGGSVIDCGKATAALVTNPGKITDYLEVVGLGKPILLKPLPLIAIPTTSGTGSEVTKNAVLGVPQTRIKVSMRHNWLIPLIAIIDPELTYSMPPQITAYTGMDALTQVIEPFLSKKANCMTDMFSKTAIQLAGKNLLLAYKDGMNIDARAKMSFVSLMGGICLANAGLGAVHGLAGPIGGMYDCHHGAICASLLPHVMETNINALRSRDASNPIIGRFKEIAKSITGLINTNEEDGLNYIKQLCIDLKIPGLSQLGILREDFQSIAEKSIASSSMQGNPIQLSQKEIIDILENSY
jgi:alcohol dehydrogenase class IV